MFKKVLKYLIFKTFSTVKTSAAPANYKNKQTYMIFYKLLYLRY